MLSIDCQTNEELVEIDSEEFLQFSRNESLHPLLVVLFESVEEDCLLSSKSRTPREDSPGTMSIHFLSFIGMILDE